MSEDSVYLSILKFGKARGIVGVTYDELYDHLYDEGYITQEEVRFFKKNGRNVDGEQTVKYLNISRLFEESFPVVNNGKRLMSMDSYFKLLEHQELTEAQNNAASAKLFSYIAIGIAILAPVISIGVSLYQSQKPVSLSDEQIEILQPRQFDENDILNSSQRIIDSQGETNRLLGQLIEGLSNSGDSKN